MKVRADRDLPTGVLTFCLTDLEDSTIHWDRNAAAMSSAVARQQQLVTEAVEANHGVLLLAQGEGDSTVSVFVSPADAVRAAADIQRSLAAEPWPEGLSIRARIGLHTGEAEQRDGTYFGTALNRAGRIRALAAGGETFLSLATAKLVEDLHLDDATIRPLGSVELRGLSQAEQIHSLDMAGGTGLARLPTTSTSNAPRLLTSFIGRRHDLERVGLALSSSRVVTVCGPGGSGKTRLAVELSHDLSGEGLGAVRFADLAPIEDPALIGETVIASLAITEPGQPGEDAAARIATAVGVRKVVLVLDNCEHLIRAARDLVAAVVKACPELRVLATSQVPLGIPGETVLPLAPLTTPPVGSSDGKALEAESVQLLVDRASRHDPDFRPSAPQALAEICRRLDGLPLALELAAAHLRFLDPDQMLDRLDADRFGLLGGTHAVTDGRHASLEPTLDWSYGLLDDRSRTLLSRLSIFSGGFTLPAAEAVCSDDELPATAIYETLTDLVSRSLIATRARGGQVRYWLLETIREYAAKKLAAAPAPATAPWRLVREGQMWAVEADRTVRLRASKGLAYLAALLERPGSEIHVLDLVAPGANRAAESEGDDLLDATARRQYRERMDDLRTEADEARAANDSERAARLEAELDEITAHLTGSTGLGGRARRTAGAAERARMSVNKALRTAIAAIEKESPTVGAHLDRSIRTGFFCSYRPDGEERVVVNRL